MNVKYLYSQIRSVLAQLYELTGLMISLYNTEKEIARCSATMSGFCELVHGSPKNRGLCDSDMSFYRTALEQGAPIKHRNPCGLYEVAIPFYLAGERTGVLAIGQFRMADSPDEADVAAFARHMALSEKELMNEYGKLPLLTDEKIRAAVNVLSVMLDGILAEKLIQFTRPKLVDTIMGYIRENPGTDLTGDALAKRFAVSRSKLFRLFRDEGTTLHAFVLEERMRVAGRMLRKKYTIDEVCAAIRFPNRSYFYRAFKKHYGAAPCALISGVAEEWEKAPLLVDAEKGRTLFPGSEPL